MFVSLTYKVVSSAYIIVFARVILEGKSFSKELSDNYFWSYNYNSDTANATVAGVIQPYFLIFSAIISTSFTVLLCLLPCLLLYSSLNLLFVES